MIKITPLKKIWVIHPKTKQIVKVFVNKIMGLDHFTAVGMDKKEWCFNISDIVTEHTNLNNIQYN